METDLPETQQLTASLDFPKDCVVGHRGHLSKRNKQLHQPEYTDKKPIKQKMRPGGWRQKVILKDNISQETGGVLSLTALVSKKMEVISDCGLLLSHLLALT